MKHNELYILNPPSEEDVRIYRKTIGLTPSMREYMSTSPTVRVVNTQSSSLGHTLVRMEPLDPDNAPWGVGNFTWLELSFTPIIKDIQLKLT